MRKEITYIEITPDELSGIITENVKAAFHTQEQQIQALLNALSRQAPTLTREQAAAYCDRSTSWIDARRKEDNLPVVTVGGQPRIRREDLDHLLRGGSFDHNGNHERESDYAHKTPNSQT